MFRIGLKFPVNGLNLKRINKRGVERLYIPARNYETKPKQNCAGRLFKDVTLASRLSGHRYSTESKSEKVKGAGTLMFFGVTTIGAIGILAYAKNDVDFRDKLESWLPGTDRAIQIIFQEEASYFEFILKFFENLKQSILGLILPSANKPGVVKTTVDCKDIEDFRPPRPAFIPEPEEPAKSTEKPVPEIRLTEETGKIEVVTQKPDEAEHESVTTELHDLEKYGGELAQTAIAAFKEAACAVQDYNRYVIRVVESSDSTVSQPIWDGLKQASEKKMEALQIAEKKADEALEALKKVRNCVDDPQIQATQGQKIIARRNISNILASVDEAKKKFEEESANANITDRYWKSVKTARETFHKELEILFPYMNIDDKKFTVTEEAFDLFVVHMYHKIVFLQKELEKMKTVAEAKLKSALKSDLNDEKFKQAVELEVCNEKMQLQKEYELKVLEELKAAEEEKRRQLKIQAQIHADHVRELIASKNRELERQVNRALNERREDENLKQKTQLAAIVGRLRGIDEALKSRLDAEKDAQEVQLMWGACQALARAVKATPPGTPLEKAVRPLEPEITGIVKAAPKGDPFVNATIKGIPEEAATRGVYPEDALRERFMKVEQMARRLALVPEGGASLPIYLLSYLQSFLLVKAVNPIPSSELDDQPIDADSLDTYDILQRARYWLDRGDFKMTLRYMNLLKGAPRSVARDWMNETRILLETQQAIETLVAYAGASTLIFMGGGETGNKKKAA